MYYFSKSVDLKKTIFLPGAFTYITVIKYLNIRDSPAHPGDPARAFQAAKTARTAQCPKVHERENVNKWKRGEFSSGFTFWYLSTQ